MSPSIPTPHELCVRRRIDGAPDAHGNPVVSYGPMLAWAVHGVAPGANRESPEANREASHVLWTVYAPTSCDVPTEYDRVVVEGVEYDVEGRPKDWSHGPWAHPTAGVVVELIARRG